MIIMSQLSFVKSPIPPNIKIPVSINPDEIFKYDPKSDYYNDMCFPYNNEDGAAKAFEQILSEIEKWKR